MKFAVLTLDEQFVGNVIVADASQKDELAGALGRKLIDAGPLGLTVGDFYNGVSWTRNVNGEQVALPLGDSTEVDEAIDIITGVTTDVDE